MTDMDDDRMSLLSIDDINNDMIYFYLSPLKSHTSYRIIIFYFWSFYKLAVACNYCNQQFLGFVCQLDAQSSFTG